MTIKKAHVKGDCGTSLLLIYYSSFCTNDIGHNKAPNRNTESYWRNLFFVCASRALVTFVYQMQLWLFPRKRTNGWRNTRRLVLYSTVLVLRLPISNIFFWYLLNVVWSPILCSTNAVVICSQNKSFCCQIIILFSQTSFPGIIPWPYLPTQSIITACIINSSLFSWMAVFKMGFIICFLSL